MKKDFKLNSESLDFLYQYSKDKLFKQLDEISSIDSKCSIIIAVYSLLIIALFDIDSNLLILDIFKLITGILLIVGLLLCIYTLTLKKWKNIPKSYSGNYDRKSKSYLMAKFYTYINAAIYYNSSLLSKKTRYLRWGIILLLISTSMFFLIILTQFIGGDRMEKIIYKDRYTTFESNDDDLIDIPPPDDDDITDWIQKTAEEEKIERRTIIPHDEEEGGED